jgi:hypothetical protein
LAVDSSAPLWHHFAMKIVTRNQFSRLAWTLIVWVVASAIGERCAKAEDKSGSIDAFVTKVYVQARGLASRNKPAPTPKGESLDLTTADWEKLAVIDGAIERGRYTLNPHMEKLKSKDFERMLHAGQYKVVSMKEFDNKKSFVVGSAVMKNFAGEYYIPGIEFMHWLFENQDKLPKEMREAKSGTEFWFFGSLVGDSEGIWGVPSMRAVIGDQAKAAGGPWALRLHENQSRWWESKLAAVILLKK